jgi:hypothetical protein
LAAKTRHEGIPLRTVNEAWAGLHGHAPCKSNARLVSTGCDMAELGAVTKETASIPVAGCAAATPNTPAKTGPASVSWQAMGVTKAERARL